MKPSSFRPLAGAVVLLGLSVLGSAQTATTDPVGFMTLPINAAGAPGAKAISFRALGLFRPVDFQGVASSVSANPLNSPTPDSISITSPGWTANQFNGANGKYYVELLGAAGVAGAGTTYDIVSTTLATDPNTQVVTGTLTLAQRLADNVAGTPAFRIRKHWTIADAFGAANDKGLAGGTATTADIIQVYSGGTYLKYYYNTAAPGWRLGTDTTTDVGGTVLYPDDGLVIIRQGANTSQTTQVVVMGAVKTGQTSFPIVAGQNFLANPYAAPMTLGSSNLYTTDPATGVAAGFATTADQVLIYNGTNYDTYYYSAGGSPGAGWRKVNGGTADASATPIPAGSSFIVKRINPGSFNWVSPQHPVSF
ncbi:MAG TPA: TIGR02597 family protein [Chthoniobacteraceae bacterium]|jgi:uncharacterized protein (TIGR02597 family)|nr:TIGR02597 family protein [Chthoniobacteraceae bacterium]